MRKIDAINFVYFPQSKLQLHPIGIMSGRLGTSRHQRDYSPVAWTDYFDEAHDVAIGEDTFRVYLKNFQHPYAPVQRGYGQRYDSLSSTINEFNAEELANFSRVPTLVALHGGGYSALTWAPFTRHIQQHCQCRVMALDLRGHGDTKTQNESRMDMTTLVDDVVSTVHATHLDICGFPETPKIVLIGHSMGGAIAIKCAAQCQESLPSLAGFVVIDVVEGTAKEALPLMMSVIKTRPTRFPSLSNAIEWCVRSGMAKNAEAARVSMPGNLVNITSGLLAIHDLSVKQGSSAQLTNDLKKHKFSISMDQLIGPSPPSALLNKDPRLPSLPHARVAALRGSSVLTTSVRETEINENDDGNNLVEKRTQDQADDGLEVASPSDNQGYKKPPSVDQIFGYTWRTNLAKTQPYWNGWFEGLSEQMLMAPVQGKFLLLAGIDRLDKTLTIGQMQGKFMMKVLPRCGHAVHEDVPDQVALAIGDFLVRNKFTVAA